MIKKIPVLITSYEVAPFFKRGGLGDVIGALPKALNDIGVDARVVMPYYQEVRTNYPQTKIGEFFVHFGNLQEEISVYQSYLPSCDVLIYFLSNKSQLSVINTRGRNKKIDQFAFFDLAVVQLVLWLSHHKKWTPAIIHCNDWQTALIPLILKLKKNIPTPIQTLLTIHNLAYQGSGSLRVLNLLHIKDEDAKEIKRGMKVTVINILGEGILHATKVSTVSRQYAKEIIEDKNVGSIYDYLRRRAKEFVQDGSVSGILNGIDYQVWNPKTDVYITKPYHINSWEIGKAENKSALLQNLSLTDKPTFCFVGRMARQKGLDILVRAIDKLLRLDINIIILGTGDRNIEKSVLRVAKLYPSRVRAEIMYNEELAHKVYAGSDFIIIPSRFEPCGLIQMIAMRYGTLPIASTTGGLIDSIENGKTGFLFKKHSAWYLRKAVKKALVVYKEKERYKTMVRRAMKKDFSWDRASRKYKKLYEEMIYPSAFK